MYVFVFPYCVFSSIPSSGSVRGGEGCLEGGRMECTKFCDFLRMSGQIVVQNTLRRFQTAFAYIFTFSLKMQTLSGALELSVSNVFFMPPLNEEEFMSAWIYMRVHTPHTDVSASLILIVTL